MEESEKQIECGNCGKMINESKFDLHEAYCKRNIIRCPKCNEPINKNEQQEHDEQFHLPVPCKYCQQKFEKLMLENHMKNCLYQPEICQYCQMPIKKKEMKNHEAECGARTDVCPFCKSRIQLNQLEEHKIYCQINEEMKKEESKYENQFPSLNEQKKTKPQSHIQNNQKKPINSKEQQKEQQQQIKPSRKSPKKKPIFDSKINQNQEDKRKQNNQQQQQAEKRSLYEELLWSQSQDLNNFGDANQKFADQFNELSIQKLTNMNQQAQNIEPEQLQDNYQNSYEALYNLNPEAYDEPKIPQKEQILKKEFSAFSNDEEMQKAIEMSLQEQWKQPISMLGKTMDSEEFKRALEKSKLEK